jgi:putative colanic acid biosynthesis UDP-glucose lipid carrier transferase
MSEVPIPAPPPAATMHAVRNAVMPPPPQPQPFPVAPPSIHAFVAAVLEPAVTVSTLLMLAVWFHETIDRPELILCMLVVVITFPGADRFKENRLTAALNIASDWMAVVAILMLCGYATDSFEFFSSPMLTAWAVLTPVLQWVAALAVCSWLQRVTERPEFRRRSIVVGAGENGVRVAKALAGQQNCAHELVGFFEDRNPDRVHNDALGKVLGGIDDVAETVKREGIHHVYITLPLTAQPRIVELLSQLQDTTSSVHYAPDVFGINIIQGQLQNIGGVPVVSLLESPITGTNHLVKRGTDIVLASLILVLTLPVLLALALGVKLSSPGPVIFKQRRTGLDGKEILVYKFRSMTTQDNGSVVQQATRSDPRITPFGAFIRKTSLDELPQLFNVLLGSMSLVGPRPHAVAHNEAYRKIVQAYMLRHKVRPGITGWAQVNGFRGETDTVDKMAARVHYDLEYLRNWSLGLDLKIIARTVRVLVFDRNAY